MKKTFLIITFLIITLAIFLISYNNFPPIEKKFIEFKNFYLKPWEAPLGTELCNSKNICNSEIGIREPKYINLTSDNPDVHWLAKFYDIKKINKVFSIPYRHKIAGKDISIYVIKFNSKDDLESEIHKRPREHYFSVKYLKKDEYFVIIFQNGSDERRWLQKIANSLQRRLKMEVVEK